MEVMARIEGADGSAAGIVVADEAYDAVAIAGGADDAADAKLHSLNSRSSSCSRSISSSVRKSSACSLGRLPA